MLPPGASVKFRLSSNPRQGSRHAIHQQNTEQESQHIGDISIEAAMVHPGQQVGDTPQAVPERADKQAIH
jgi:hypothetical protein